ncbi:uncharacterized protein BDZ99DRAFT_443981 [Mytilinidion resinicola]|uniref:Disease resistance R13L4/SHOC-2-like LRR domain-containing protein n=1 Tax=Mytilinidion resinicola TaxID=574789 RepID=A0A6A6YM36_9PEZI|nr:uncharacterized protein BDZ99DRAFT_443981 [Mytilinidion resinicola]KAF2809598.1 hypothetical protein BDZ99DRAFT_443981 [Mytilinidion resinicola]
MSNDPPKPMTDQDVVALAREAIENSREEHKRAVAETPGASKDLRQQPGITIDLGHKNIVSLPDEVIDVIRTEIERLALSHNNLSNLPSRLPECRRLRYLNVRYNSLREIPLPIMQMTALEILDVSKNKIKVIPEGISNLISLKVLAIQKNKIERLPVGLGDISSLQVLKLDGNPIVFPPPHVCTINDNAPSPSNDNEKDAVIATQVKKYMRQYASDISNKQRRRVEAEGSESESNVETPRPSKRAVNGRFPVKPSISNLDIFAGPPRLEASPGVPPPIPTRSHYREQSQQNSNLSRGPPVAPLVLSNGNNERNRSQSEGAGSATIRAKRMGIYTHKTSDLGPVDELRRNSHFRGFSQGLVLSSNGANAGNSGPATAGVYGDMGTQRPLIHRPLSDLLEHKRRSRAPDVVVEAAKSFLYAMSQLHDTMLSLVRAIKKDRSRGGYRKEELPRRFTIAYLQIKKLSELLRRFDTLAEEDEEDAHKLSASIHQTCQKSLAQFLLVNVLIAENAQAIGSEGDPRFMRSFLFLQTGSMIELRKACEVLGVNFKGTPTTGRKPQSSNRSMPPAREPRPLVVRRFQTTPPSQRTAQYAMPPPVSLHSNESSRTNTLTSISAATPRSGESFLTTSTISRTNTMQSSFDDPDEEAQFDRIYIKLKTACDQCLKNVPQILRSFRRTYETERSRLDSEDLKMKVLMKLIETAESVVGVARTLSERLSEIKLKDAVARSQRDFWQQCTLLTKAWNDMAAAIAGDGRKVGLLAEDVKILMKPTHHAVKDAGLMINNSSWSYLAHSAPNAGGSMGPPGLQSLTSKTQPPKFYSNQSSFSAGHGPGFPGPINTSITPAASTYSAISNYSATSFTSQSSAGGSSMGYVTPVPATPLSAALGAAAQATVPNTPNQLPGQNNTGPFAGNVFERADRLAQQPYRRI